MPRASKPKAKAGKRKPAVQRDRDLMTQAAYAKRRRCTPQHINNLVRKGVIRKVGRFINARHADAAIAAHHRPGRVVGKTPAKAVRTPRGESDTTTLIRARIQREQAQARITELELKRLVKELLPASEVRDAQRRQNANVRASFRRLPRSLAPLLHRCGSPAEIEQTLLTEIDLVLGELARDPLGLEPALPPEASAPLPMPAGSPAELRV